MGYNMAQEVTSKSNWLNAGELGGQEVEVTISEVVKTTLDDEDKMGLKFVGAKKGMILNITNNGRLMSAFGQDSDNWIGKKIVLYSEPVQFGGKMVEGLRVRVPKSAGGRETFTIGADEVATLPAAVASEPEGVPDDGAPPPSGDDIPF